jgi:hypothetical protein
MMKLKHKQTRFYALLTLLLLIAVGCGMLSKRGGVHKLKVTGFIRVESPVCDKNSDAKAESLPLANTTYYIKNGSTNHPDSIAFDEVKLDENGKFTLYLKPGTYAIVHRDKLLDFGEFRLKYAATSTYFKTRDDDCFKRWYNSPDFLVQVSSDTTLQLLAKSRCFTKTNPCIEYTGPR